MNRDIIQQELIGLTYGQTIDYFKKIKPLYFRPIKINGIELYTDLLTDNNRCNIIFENTKVIYISGWY